MADDVKTEDPATAPVVPVKAGGLFGWYNALPPHLRAALLGVVLMAVNSLLAAGWGKLFPGEPAPKVVPPAPVVVMNYVPPAAAEAAK